MTEETPKGADDSLPDPHLKEQDKGIVEVFSEAEHRVLTYSEIADDIDLSARQVRRRLNDMAERGVIGKRKAGGVNLAWLEADVKEPITVQYPLLRYVRDHTSVQLFLIGAGLGIVAVLILLAAAIAIGYNISFGYISKRQWLIYGVGVSVFAGLSVLGSIILAISRKLLRRFDSEGK